MKSFILTLTCCIAIAISTFANEPFVLTKHQAKKINSNSNNIGNGKLAAGLKFWPLGITAKYMAKENLAIEGLFYFWRYGTRLTALGEYHQKINALSGEEGSTRFYIGGGAHIGFFSNYYYDKYYVKNGRAYERGPGSVYLGLDGVLGLDFKFSEIPINLSLDFQPSFSFYGSDYIDYFSGWGGLGVRYMF